MLSLANVLFLSALLFAIGAYGVLARRNLLVVLMSIEVMLNAANLALAGFSRHFAAGGAPLAAFQPAAAAHAGNPYGGQVFVLMSMAVAACEVAVGLALLIALFRSRHSVMTVDLADLKG
jgi:NADH-quinone oxidoreductase subunit K